MEPHVRATGCNLSYEITHCYLPGCHPTQVTPSDVKRGQNLEAETEPEARALRPRPRPRPELWGQGRGRGQFLDVEVRPRPKIKLWIKKYQMMI